MCNVEPGQDWKIAALRPLIHVHFFYEDDNMNYYEELIKLSKKALKENEVPVAALIVKDNKIIAKAYNKRYKKTNPLMHAEIDCILKACKKLNDWRLNDCILYCTLEPCHMCKEIIKETRIRKVYYLSEAKKDVNYKSEFTFINNNYSIEYNNLLTNFFKKIR